MIESIRLSEYQNSEVALSVDDAEFILTHEALKGKVGLQRALDGSSYVLNPNQYVGVVLLPSGRRIESQPKIPISNLFYMIAVAFDVSEQWLLDQVTRFARLDEFLEFIVGYFADLVEERIRDGLYRRYVEREGNLNTVRGRIHIPNDVRENYVLRHRTYCVFSEFTWDIPENQIIRHVLHHVGGLVANSSLRLRLRQLDGMMGEVQPTTISPGTLDRFHYHRLNEEYRPIHNLCRLFLEGASLKEDVGMVDFRTFLIDMNRLFEVFVTNMLKARMPSGFTVTDQQRRRLDDDGRVMLRPDLIVSYLGSPVLVADCKYKGASSGEAGNQDVYQVLSYCTALAVSEGMLIYPSAGFGLPETLHIRNTDISIRRVYLDLTGTIDDVRAACTALGGQLLSGRQPLRPSLADQVV